MDCKIIYTGDKRTGVYGLDGKPSETFQEILNNGQVKDFDEALEIYKGLYSDKIELPKAKVQNSGFFSNAEQSLLNLKDKNVKNVQGWMKALTDVQKNGGIKNVNQELEWIGLEDYLNDYVKENNPKAGNIPFSVVEDYIKSNQIEIVDISKGGILSSKFDQEKYDDIEWQLNNFFEDGEFEPNEYNRGLDLLNSWRDNPNNSTFQAVVGFWNKQADSMNGQREDLRITNENTSLVSDDTKYSGYQLKGAENYREVLLTMPNNSLLKYKESLTKKYGEGYKGSQLTDEEIDKLQDLKQQEIKGNYKSSHWDEVNILAHVRLNEKTLPDGRRVLIVNEIQSDSGQAIKKDEDFLLKEIENNFDNIYNKLLKSGIIKEDC